MTYFDLCGCVLFPGSSNVHAEFDVRHDWHGCPSSHLIRRRLCAPQHRQHGFAYRGRVCSPTTVARPIIPQARQRRLGCGAGEEWRKEGREEGRDAPAQLEPPLLEDGARLGRLDVRRGRGGEPVAVLLRVRLRGLAPPHVGGAARRVGGVHGGQAGTAQSVDPSAEKASFADSSQTTSRIPGR